MRFLPIRFESLRSLYVHAGAALGIAVLIAGCGSQYRPVVTPINPSGPPAQPSSFVAVVSAPSPTSPGIATIIDYSGDAVMATAPIGPGPLTFTVDQTGSTGYTYNSDGTLTNFQISSQLQYKNLEYSTLVDGTQAINLYSGATGLWVADFGQNGSLADVMQGFPETFKLSIPVAATPVMVIASPSVGQRVYALSQVADANGTDCNVSPTTVTLNGAATPIEISTNNPDAAIALDPFNTATVSSKYQNALCPVYGVESADGRRLFVLNRGSDTISVINVQNDTLDQCTPFTDQSGQLVTCHPIFPLSTTAVAALQADAAQTGAPTGIPTSPPNGTTGMTATAGPVYAEYNQATQQLVVSNYDGGTISVIDVSLDVYGNDSQTFGTTFTIPVGNTKTPYPASVTVLADGSRAYTANQGESTVTIANLSSHTVEKTVPVTGHPRTVVSTQNSLYGKVYAGAPDSPYLTILRTDLDIVDTTVLVQGNIVDVRTSSQNGTTGNAINTSRRPGFGQPCNVPPNVLDPASPDFSLANCRLQPTK